MTASLKVCWIREFGVREKTRSTYFWCRDLVAKMYPLRPLNHVDIDLAAVLRWPKKLQHRQWGIDRNCRTVRGIDISHFGRWDLNGPVACCRLWAMHQVALWWDKLLLLGDKKKMISIKITFNWIGDRCRNTYIFMNNLCFSSNQSNSSFIFCPTIHTNVHSIFVAKITMTWYLPATDHLPTIVDWTSKIKAFHLTCTWCMAFSCRR